MTDDSQVVPDEEEQLATVLELVESIPDSVIEEGEDAVARYVQEWQSQSVQAEGIIDVAKCAGAILVALGTSSIAASKILKLKEFVKEAGGVKEAAKDILAVASGEKKLSELGATLATLGAEVLSIPAIKAGCGL